MTEFLVEPDQRFSCTRCSHCCLHSTFPVALNDKEHAWFSGQNLGNVFANIGDAPVAERVAEDLWHLASRNERCLFLSEDGLCRIHRDIGAEAKPAGCRQFPLLFTDTPDGLLVHTSFASPAAVRNLGPRVAEQTDWLEASFRDHTRWGYETSRTPDRAKMTAGGPELSWRQYRHIEDKPRAALLDDGPSLTESLAHVDAIFQHVRGSLPARTGPITDSSVTETLAQAPLSGESDPSVSTLRRQIGLIGPFIAVVEQASHHETASHRFSPREAWSLYQLATALRNLRTTVMLPRLGGELDLTRLSGVVLDQDDPTLEPYLRRYLASWLYRKSLLVRPTLTEAYQSFLSTLMLTRWYAAAIAVRSWIPAHGSLRVTDLHLVRAIQLVENYYVLHHDLFQSLNRFGVIRSLVSLQWNALRDGRALIASPFTGVN